MEEHCANCGRGRTRCRCTKFQPCEGPHPGLDEPQPPAPVADVEARIVEFDQWMTEQIIATNTRPDDERIFIFVQREFRRRFEITEGEK